MCRFQGYTVPTGPKSQSWLYHFFSCLQELRKSLEQAQEDHRYQPREFWSRPGFRKLQSEGVHVILLPWQRDAAGTGSSRDRRQEALGRVGDGLQETPLERSRRRRRSRQEGPAHREAPAKAEVRKRSAEEGSQMRHTPRASPPGGRSLEQGPPARGASAGATWRHHPPAWAAADSCRAELAAAGGRPLPALRDGFVFEGDVKGTALQLPQRGSLANPSPGPPKGAQVLVS